jgi:hypothetical protein
LGESIAGQLDASKKIDIELNTGTRSSKPCLQNAVQNHGERMPCECLKKYLGRLPWIIIEYVQKVRGDEIQKTLIILSSKFFVFLSDIYKYKS